MEVARVQSVAFKEWAVVVRAIELGVQDVILRKGGIQEDGGAFTVDHSSFYLMPTYFHQQRAGVRAEHASLLDEALALEPSPGRLRITSWVEVVAQRVLASDAELETIVHRHVYTREVVRERLYGRHGKALHALTVRVHRLDEALDLPLSDAYAGCKSWVELVP